MRVVAIDLLDDPDDLKAADALPDGTAKDEIKVEFLERLSRGEMEASCCPGKINGIPRDHKEGAHPR